MAPEARGEEEPAHRREFNHSSTLQRIIEAMCQDTLVKVEPIEVYGTISYTSRTTSSLTYLPCSKYYRYRLAHAIVILWAKYCS